MVRAKVIMYSVEDSSKKSDGRWAHVMRLFGDDWCVRGYTAFASIADGGVARGLPRVAALAVAKAWVERGEVPG